VEGKPGVVKTVTAGLLAGLILLGSVTVYQQVLIALDRLDNEDVIRSDNVLILCTNATQPSATGP